MSAFTDRCNYSPVMSAFGGKADEIGRKAEMPPPMSAYRGKADYLAGALLSCGLRCPFRDANISQDSGDAAHLVEQVPVRLSGDRQRGEVLIALNGGSRLGVQHAVDRARIEPEASQKALQFAYLVLAESGLGRRRDQPQAHANDKPAQDHAKLISHRLGPCLRPNTLRGHTLLIDTGPLAVDLLHQLNNRQAVDRALSGPTTQQALHSVAALVAGPTRARGVPQIQRRKGWVAHPVE